MYSEVLLHKAKYEMNRIADVYMPIINDNYYLVLLKKLEGKIKIILK